MTSECLEIEEALTQQYVVEVTDDPGCILPTLLPFVVDLEHYLISTAAQRIIDCGRQNYSSQDTINFQLNRMREILIERFLAFESDESLARNFRVLFPAFPIVSRKPLPSVPQDLYTLIRNSHVGKTYVPSIEPWEFSSETRELVARLISLKNDAPSSEPERRAPRFSQPTSSFPSPVPVPSQRKIAVTKRNYFEPRP